MFDENEFNEFLNNSPDVSPNNYMAFMNKYPYYNMPLNCLYFKFNIYNCVRRFQYCNTDFIESDTFYDFDKSDIVELVCLIFTDWT